METTLKKGCQQLRRGRWSSQHQIYHVTFVTLQRRRYFTDFEPARAMVAALRHATPDAETLAFVVMPDHVHWLLQLGGSKSLGKVVGKAKADVSRRRFGGGVIVTWQDGFHDHALRKDEDLQSVARYIVANPLRAGLVTTVRDYPFWDAVWV